MRPYVITYQDGMSRGEVTLMLNYGSEGEAKQTLMRRGSWYSRVEILSVRPA